MRRYLKISALMRQQEILSRALKLLHFIISQDIVVYAGHANVDCASVLPLTGVYRDRDAKDAGNTTHIPMRSTLSECTAATKLSSQRQLVMRKADSARKTMPLEKKTEPARPTLLRSFGFTSSVVQVKFGKPPVCRTPIRNLRRKFS